MALASASTVRVSSTTGNRIKQRMLRVDADDSLPITLRHERIYILPTKRGLAFMAVVMMMLLASMNYSLNLGYALSFMMVGLFASCLLSTYINIAQLCIQSAQSEDTFAGMPLQFCITLVDKRNRKRHSINITADGATDRIDIAARQAGQAILRVTDRPRGLHALGRITLSSDFPLGLWRGWGYVHTPVNGYVYPKPENPAADFPSNQHDAGDHTTATNTEREFKQLKRYQPSDSPGSVAWKTVARSGNWYSKEFESERSAQHLSFNWNDTPGQHGVEQRLSRMCAWILAADADNHHYSVDLPHATIKSQHGTLHRQTCLRSLTTYMHAHDRG